MERKGVPFNEINVDEDEAARKMVEASASQLKPPTILPMVVVKDGRGNVRTWHGFRYDEIKGLTKTS
jgi:glutaredoxin